MANKVIKAIPIIALGAMLIYTWIVYILTNYTPVIKDWATLALFLVNVIVYFFRFQVGIIFTGVVLILATLTLIQFTPMSFSQNVSFYIGKFEFNSPFFELRMLLLFIIFLIINRASIRTILNKK
jgi:hypothetical protein